MSTINFEPSTSWGIINSKSETRNFVLVTKDDFFEKDLFADEIYERKSSIHVSRVSTLPNEDSEENNKREVDSDKAGKKRCNLLEERKEPSLQGTHIGQVHAELRQGEQRMEPGRIVPIEELFMENEEEKSTPVSPLFELSHKKETEEEKVCVAPTKNDANGTYSADNFFELDEKLLFGIDPKDKEDKKHTGRNTNNTDKTESLVNSLSTRESEFLKSSEKQPSEESINSFNLRSKEGEFSHNHQKDENNDVWAYLEKASKCIDVDDLFNKNDKEALCNEVKTRSIEAKDSIAKEISIDEDAKAATSIGKNSIDINSINNTGKLNSKEPAKQFESLDIAKLSLLPEVANSSDQVKKPSKIKELLDKDRETKDRVHKDSISNTIISPNQHRFSSNLADIDHCISKVNTPLKQIDEINSKSSSRKSSFQNDFINNRPKKEPLPFARSRMFSNADKETPPVVVTLNTTNNNVVLDNVTNPPVMHKLSPEVQPKLTEEIGEPQVSNMHSQSVSSIKKKDFNNRDFKALKDKDKKSFYKNLSPCVGVGIFLVDQKRERLLIGRRIDSGLYGLPGGWIEFGEEIEECASRELKEETGISKAPSCFHHIYTLNYFNSEKTFHTVSCVMYSAIDDEDLFALDNKEPNKCYGWFWIGLPEIRSMSTLLFPPLREFMKKYSTIGKASELKTYFRAKLDLDSLFDNGSLIDL